MSKIASNRVCWSGACVSANYNFCYYLRSERIWQSLCEVKIMAASIRSTGCCAIASLVTPGQIHNSVKQDKWENSPKGLTGSNDLASKLWGNSLRTPILHKNGDQLTFRSGNAWPARCQKMFVPGFGEASPESKAADALHNFFTYVAVKIVASQLQDYNKEAYVDLMEFVERVPLKDGDKFCAELMRESFRHRNLALRIMEVRSAYARQDFEWDNLQNLSLQHMDEANTTLMRTFLIETSKME